MRIHGKNVKRRLCLAAALLMLSGLCPCGAKSGEEEGMNRENNARVFYEIFVGSFSDSDGDGTGDLRGIINRMDYLNDGDPASGNSLGIEGIWLTPVFLSPSYHKYDVTDYFRIDPLFGTEEDLKELITLCHARDVKLILDLPMNHTGREHEWFRKFREAHAAGHEADPYYNWYTWIREGDPVPAGRRFTALPGTDILYECNFSDDMPELNFDRENVREAALEVAMYWMNLGVDGFRFDAAKYPYFGEHEKNILFWNWYMNRLRETDPDLYAVAEVWDDDSVIEKYQAVFNCFHFSSAMAEGILADTARSADVDRLTRYVRNYQETIHAIRPGSMDILFLANHDTDRAAGFLTAASGCAQMAANLYLLSPGSPFIYYGEEIGLRGSRGGADTDANRRLAMRWGDGDTVRDPEGSTYDTSGFATVADREKMKSSILWHYRKVIAARKANPEIARGAYTALAFSGTKAGGFLCNLDESVVAVLHNPSAKKAVLDLKAASGREFTEVAAVLEAVQGEGGAELKDGVVTLWPQTSVILRAGD